MQATGVDTPATGLETAVPTLEAETAAASNES
jgi:hypothetical protein